MALNFDFKYTSTGAYILYTEVKWNVVSQINHERREREKKEREREKERENTTAHKKHKTHTHTTQTHTEKKKFRIFLFSFFCLSLSQRLFPTESQFLEIFLEHAQCCTLRTIYIHSHHTARMSIICYKRDLIQY